MITISFMHKTEVLSSKVMVTADIELNLFVIKLGVVRACVWTITSAGIIEIKNEFVKIISISRQSDMCKTNVCTVKVKVAFEIKSCLAYNFVIMGGL
jgi:hypothetical protein